MLEFDCRICGVKIDLPETYDNGSRIHYDHRAAFCDSHTMEEVENYIDKQLEGVEEE